MNNGDITLIHIAAILGGIAGFVAGMRVWIHWLKKFIKDTKHADRDKKRKRIMIVASIAAFIGFMWMLDAFGHIKEPPIAISIIVLGLGLILFFSGTVTLFIIVFRRRKED